MTGDTARRERLGQALRQLRTDAGLTGTTLAKRLRVAQSSISRMEAGRQVLSPEQVDAWALATGASAERHAELDQLAEAAATEAVAWRRRSLAAMQRETADFEDSAGLNRGYHPLLVHTLLQVPDYAAASYRARAFVQARTSDEIAEAIAERMRKQAVLHKPGHRFEFLQAEAGLRWRFVTGDVMAAQLDRMGQVARMPNVLLGILPMDTQAPTWRWMGFGVFLERAGEAEDTVLVEALASEHYIRDPAAVAHYNEAWTRLLELAVTGQDALALLERIGEDLR